MVWRIPQVTENVEMALSRIHSTGETAKQAALFDSLVNEIDRLVSDKEISTALIKLEELRNIQTFGSNIVYYAATRKLYPYCIQGKIKGQYLWVNSEAISHFCFSPSCDRALIVKNRERKIDSKGGVERDNTLMLLDINTGQCIKILDLDYKIKTICFSPDSRLAAWSVEKKWENQDTGKVILWNTVTGEYLHTLNTDEEYFHPDYVAFSPDGAKVFVSDSFNIKAWDILTKECLYTFRISPNCLSASNEGLKAIANDGNMTDFLTGKCISNFKNGVGEICCFSPDSSKVLRSFNDGTMYDDALKLWDIKTDICLLTFHPNVDKRFSCACFSPDGSKIFTSSSNIKNECELTFWDTYSGECLHSINTHGKIKSGCFAPDGRIIFSLEEETIHYGSDCELKLWDIDTQECLHTFGSRKYGQYTFSPDGKRIAYKVNGTIYIYELDYELYFPGWADWDEGAQPYLKIFLTLHPNWTDEDFDNILIPELQRRGYGWLRPEGVKAKLKEMNTSSLIQSTPVQPVIPSQQDNIAQETRLNTQTDQPDKKRSFWKRLTGGGK